jgi:hypothetical protein
VCVLKSNVQWQKKYSRAGNKELNRQWRKIVVAGIVLCNEQEKVVESE